MLERRSEIFEKYCKIIEIIEIKKVKIDWRCNMMKKYKYEDILVGLSVLAVLISGYDSLYQTNVLNLAGTQWMLIALVLGVYGIYAKMRMN